MGLILGYDRTMKRELQGQYVIMQKYKGVKKGTKIGQPAQGGLRCYETQLASRAIKRALDRECRKYASYQGIFTC
jgi:hypothetical protein